MGRYWLLCVAERANQNPRGVAANTTRSDLGKDRGISKKFPATPPMEASSATRRVLALYSASRAHFHSPPKRTLHAKLDPEDREMKSEIEKCVARNLRKHRCRSVLRQMCTSDHAPLEYKPRMLSTLVYIAMTKQHTCNTT